MAVLTLKSGIEVQLIVKQTYEKNIRDGELVSNSVMIQKNGKCDLLVFKVDMINFHLVRFSKVGNNYLHQNFLLSYCKWSGKQPEEFRDWYIDLGAQKICPPKFLSQKKQKSVIVLEIYLRASNTFGSSFNGQKHCKSSTLQEN